MSYGDPQIQEVIARLESIIAQLAPVAEMARTVLADRAASRIPAPPPAPPPPGETPAVPGS